MARKGDNLVPHLKLRTALIFDVSHLPSSSFSGAFVLHDIHTFAIKVSRVS